MFYPFSYEAVFLVRDTLSPTIKSSIVTVNVNDIPNKLLIDTGASMNILTRIDYNMYSKRNFQEISVRIYTSGSTWTHPIPEFFKAEIQFKDSRIKLTVYIVDVTISGSHTRLQNLSQC